MSGRKDTRGARRGGGIDTIVINSAREMHAKTVQARVPTTSGRVSYRGPQMEPTTLVPPAKMGSPRLPTPRHKCNNPNNPPCAHCGGVIIPSPSATMPLEDNPSLSIGDWTISSKKKPILNAGELDDWETNQLSGLGALPEMIFGNNFIRIMNTKHNWGIEYNALDALRMVKLSDSGIRVAHSKDWINSKKKQRNSQTDGIDIESSLKIVKNYDWTYSTEYEGTIIGDDKEIHKFTIDNNLKLPIDKLSRPDQILFFDDMILFEDELADCGISLLNVKIRVMDERLLLLSRFFLRVDDVLLKVYDTRVYVELDENKIIREIKKHEGNYNEILSKHHMSHAHDPKAALRDSNWVVDHTPLVERRCETLTF